jgi:P27 family predicted phage terminase small subunit
MARPRKPAEIRTLEGNRSRRPIPKEIPGIGHPEPPTHLTAEQLDRWLDIVGSLPVELLSRADVQVLERMAVAWAAFRQTTILINQSGLLTRGQRGEPVYNPLLRVRSAATEEMHACGQVLGLSPLARTRLTAPEEQDADPLAILLGPHGKAWGDERIPAKN